jgi:hypothetical protein
MFANSAEGRAFARILSRQVVEKFAPEELEMFDELYEESLVSPPGAVKAGPDDELGFGADALMVVATPVVSAAVQAVITFLVTEVIKASKEETTALIQQKLKALLNAEKKKSPAPLTQEQLLMVKKLTVKRAREMGMKEEKANQLALKRVCI